MKPELPGEWLPLLGPHPRRAGQRYVPPAAPVHVRADDGVLALPLGHGAWTLVSAEDQWAANLRWFRTIAGYVVGNFGGKQLFLHRLVCYVRHELRGAAPKDPEARFRVFWMAPTWVVDHIDRDPLNNQRSNLRMVDQTLNNFNQSPRREGASVPGVSFHAEKGCWYAKTKIDGRTINVGRFRTERQAERAIAATRQRLVRQRRRELAISMKDGSDAPF